MFSNILKFKTDSTSTLFPQNIYWTLQRNLRQKFHEKSAQLKTVSCSPHSSFTHAWGVFVFLWISANGKNVLWEHVRWIGSDVVSILRSRDPHCFYFLRCFHNMAIHINTPVRLDEETPPPYPPRHLLYQLAPALRVVGSVGVRATQAEKHSFDLKLPKSPHVHVFEPWGSTHTWREPSRQAALPLHIFCCFQNNSNIYRSSTKCNCDFQMFLNCVKCISHNLCKTFMWQPILRMIEVWNILCFHFKWTDDVTQSVMSSDV